MFVATAATPPVAVRQTSASTTPLATALTAQAAMKPSSHTLALKRITRSRTRSPIPMKTSG